MWGTIKRTVHGWSLFEKNPVKGSDGLVASSDDRDQLEQLAKELTEDRTLYT